MSEFTFDENAEDKNKKEDIEWLNIWCEDTNDHSMPRIALIGDSITAQTYGIVKRELKDVAKIDYLATSYSILSPAYVGMVESFITDSNYEIIYFNYGLHGHGVSDDEYENAYRNMLQKFLIRSKVIIGLTTTVLDKDNLDKESEVWSNKVKARNGRAIKLANEFNLYVDDLYEISQKLGRQGKTLDGVHFNEQGNELIGKSKAEAIKKVWFKTCKELG